MAEGAPFVTIVRERMRESGMGLRELCRSAEVDPSYLSKVLAGKRSPPWEEGVLRRLASALGLDPVRLIVSAGRIPEEWRRLWSDEAALAWVHEALTAPKGASAKGPTSSEGWRSPLPTAKGPSPSEGRPSPYPERAESQRTPLLRPLHPRQELGEELL